jgi:hypothetical protein
MKIAEILTLIFIFGLVGVVVASWFQKMENKRHDRDRWN